MLQVPHERRKYRRFQDGKIAEHIDGLIPATRSCLLWAVLRVLEEIRVLQSQEQRAERHLTRTGDMLVVAEEEGCMRRSLVGLVLG